MTDEGRDLAGLWAETASMAAHELRNPLMSVKGLASTGSRMYDQLTDDERREFFRLIDEEAARLARVIDETATAFRIDAGAIVYDIRPEPLADVVDEAVGKTGLEGRPVELETDGAPTVPCDRASLVDVLTHLLSNADRFSPSGLPVRVRAASDDGHAVIDVMDGGPGIPPGDREEAFARFSRYRAPGYEEIQGAGLGLFISRAHVRAQGGDLTLNARSGGGTMLRVTLPGEETERE